jgi:5-methylcytosine-specific restriction endonuclease McrA
MPLSDFGKLTSSTDGKHNTCLLCRRSQNSAYKKRYPEKVAAQKKRSYERNPEKHIQRTRDYRLRNPEIDSIWKKNNVVKVREYTNRRRKAVIANGIYEIRQSFLKRLYASSCVICGTKKRIEMDHVIPISRGGYHGEGNLQPLCKTCNVVKRDRFVIEFKIYLKKFDNLY